MAKAVNVSPIPRYVSGTSKLTEPYQMLEKLQKVNAEWFEAKVFLLWHEGWNPDKDGRLRLGQISLATPEDKAVYGHSVDAVISLNHEVWHDGDFDSWRREGVIFHELCHLAIARNKQKKIIFDDLGRIVYRLRGHTIEEFPEVVERYGAYLVQHEQFAAALSRSRALPLFEKPKASKAEPLPEVSKAAAEALRDAEEATKRLARDTDLTEQVERDTVDRAVAAVSEMIADEEEASKPAENVAEAQTPQLAEPPVNYHDAEIKGERAETLGVSSDELKAAYCVPLFAGQADPTKPINVNPVAINDRYHVVVQAIGEKGGTRVFGVLPLHDSDEFDKLYPGQKKRTSLYDAIPADGEFKGTDHYFGMLVKVRRTQYVIGPDRSGGWIVATAPKPEEATP